MTGEKRKNLEDIIKIMTMTMIEIDHTTETDLTIEKDHDRQFIQ